MFVSPFLWRRIYQQVIVGKKCDFGVLSQVVFVSHLDEWMMWRMMLEKNYLILEVYHRRVVTVINHPLVENMDLECEEYPR